MPPTGAGDLSGTGAKPNFRPLHAVAIAIERVASHRSILPLLGKVRGDELSDWRTVPVPEPVEPETDVMRAASDSGQRDGEVLVVALEQDLSHLLVSEQA